MDSEKENLGVNDLAKVITGRIKKHLDMPPTLDFGTVKKNGSLTTNTFPVAIAKGDYSILSHFEPTEGDSTRVLVAWVGDEPVVIDSIVSS